MANEDYLRTRVKLNKSRERLLKLLREKSDGLFEAWGEYSALRDLVFHSERELRRQGLLEAQVYPFLAITNNQLLQKVYCDPLRERIESDNPSDSIEEGRQILIGIVEEGKYLLERWEQDD